METIILNIVIWLCKLLGEKLFFKFIPSLYFRSKNMHPGTYVLYKCFRNAYKSILNKKLKIRVKNDIIIFEHIDLYLTTSIISNLDEIKNNLNKIYKNESLEESTKEYIYLKFLANINANNNKHLNNLLTKESFDLIKKILNIIQFNAQFNCNVIKELQFYINRKIHKINSDNTIMDIEESSVKALSHIIDKKGKIILLGEAGKGKTFELKNINNSYINNSMGTKVVFKNLKNYISNNTIADFLPANWEKVPQNQLLLIFDGLDELSPEEYINSTKHLCNFLENNNQVKFLISCRSNFIDIFKESLDDFELFALKNFTKSDVENYMKSIIINANVDDFFDEISRLKLNNLIYNPFYLMMIV
ncbi:MAG: NACHT domain-containing protein, partial [Bacteroidales bacterium]|nr:NACHT domain-containing protein [Bacteroidales bacterium]